MHANDARFDLLDLVAHVPELEDVSRGGLDGEVFIETSDSGVAGAEQDIIVEAIRNRAAGRDFANPAGGADVAAV